MERSPRSNAPSFLTRFAPSPTGRLHLGHVANALYVWGLARLNDGRVLLRMEDHDRGRCRSDFESAILDDLDWLGFQPDIGTRDEFSGSTQYRQSNNWAVYEEALEYLRRQDLVYGCDCSRSRLSRAAPIEPGEERRYDGYCRSRALSQTGSVGLRLKMPGRSVTFYDELSGVQTQHPGTQSGDILLRDRTGNFTYQFTVVVDDMRQGITDIVRGKDLLSSTGRQLILRELLGDGPGIGWYHHPLIVENGKKLSKRDGALGLNTMRVAGLHPEQVLGRAAFLVGLVPEDGSVTIDDIPGLIHHTHGVPVSR